MPKLLVVDPAKCTSCRTCEVACSTVKEGEANPSKSRIRVMLFHDDYFYYPLVCQQCKVPYCAKLCPTGALVKDAQTEVVHLLKERCIGCRLCMLACPFGALTLVDGFPTKCDLCNGDPTCVRFCDARALAFTEPPAIGEGKRLAIATEAKGVIQSVAGARTRPTVAPAGGPLRP